MSERPKNLSRIKSEADLSALLQPVVCGADILGYAYVRSYHEAWGIRPIVLSAVDVKLTSSSKFCDYRIEAGMNDEDGCMEAVMRVGAEIEEAGKVGIIHGSADWNTRIISAHKEELSKYYVVPYIDFDLLDEITQKRRFYEICEGLGIDVPKTWYLDCTDADFVLDAHAFPYPLVAKPSHSASWDLLEFEGKKKIYEIADAAELERVWRDVRASGYAANLVVQDFVPGPDTEIRSLTTFSDADGEVRVVSGGRVIVQDRSPFAIGNPVCIMSEKVERVVEDAKRFCREVGYHGYANFDIKHDTRDDTWRFFEVNTRPGKNTYYVSLGGVNFVRPIVADWVLGEKLAYTEAYDPFVYTVIPEKVVEESVDDEDLLAQVAKRYRDGIARSPWDYAPDSLAHKAWARLSWQHQVKKFRQYR